MMPHASAWILTGLKMSLPFGLVGVIIGEFLVSSQGLGFRLNFYSTQYNTAGAISIILIMMFLMMILTSNLTGRCALASLATERPGGRWRGEGLKEKKYGAHPQQCSLTHARA